MTWYFDHLDDTPGVEQVASAISQGNVGHPRWSPFSGKHFVAVRRPEGMFVYLRGR
jgi:hypothetical protein